MKKPILLTKYELLVPISQALERLESIRQRKANNEDSIILEGLFVLANSTFENSIYDTLRILIKQIPDKIDIKNENISKDILLSGDPLKQTIERRIINISYNSLKEVINYFIKITSIPERNIIADYYDKLCEIKASRNLLLHNNLVINSIYLETAGINKRSSTVGQKLHITQNYLYDSIVVFRDILSTFKEELEVKYNDYTRLNAVRRLFKFIFDTPIMNFDNEFTCDEQNDRILRYNEDRSRRDGLSHSEEIYFSIWMSHLRGTGINLNGGNFFTLDDSNRKRFAYFLSVIDILKEVRART